MRFQTGGKPGGFAKFRATRYAFGLTLLPIAYRELRVSARNKATHRLRILFAVGAVAIGGGLGLIVIKFGGLRVSQLGLWTFEALRWISFVGACAAGTFLTSDCLSEEKREGTLGLLFLTDLRGYDVVLGKLLATSLRTFYSLLAIFPVMAVSFVLGGVAMDDFQHTLLALCNTLFFSLALGMAVSAISREPHKALTGTLAAMVAFLFLTPELDWLLLRRSANVPRIGLLSPLYAFTHTSSYHAPDFWLSIILVHSAGWCFLAIASWLVPRTWQERGVRPSLGTRWQIPLFGSADARASRRVLLNKNPIGWIISRDRWASNLARLALLLVLGVFALSLASLSQTPGAATPAPATPAIAAGNAMTTSTNGGATIFSYSTTLSVRLAANNLFVLADSCADALAIALELWLAIQVCRFYVDARKNGFLELLLVTPIRPKDILHGHWLALRRLFLVPVAAQLFLTLSCGAIEVWGRHSTALPVAPGMSTTMALSNRTLEMAQFLASGLKATSWCLGLITIVWFSIWMGLTSKKINLAMLKTFCYAKVLPWFGLSLAWIFVLVFIGAIFTGSFFSAYGVYLFPVVPQLVLIGVNFALIALARRRAHMAFSKWPNLTAA
jgi:ABC-type transport system involved in cytochrome c biogenesis permease component